jgi:putative ABC transport system permease protein
LESFWSDLKHALRVFRRSPAFTITAVATLALGLGTNIAVFSLVNAVLLKPVSAPDPDRVVAFMATNPSGSGGPLASEIKFNLWREQTNVLEDVSGLSTGWFNLTGVDQPEQVDAAFVTVNYFRLFGLPISRGRGFTSEEERPNGGNVVVLSDAFWKKAFSGDPGIVGKAISLSGSSYEVVGIMAPGAQTETATPPDVWVPFPIDPESSSQVHYFRAMGRLKPGVTLDLANAQLQLATQEFRHKYPNALSTSRRDVFSVEPLRDVLVGGVRTTLWTLGIAVSFVLLIACANVANLLLGRASVTGHEIAIRVAIGATRGRIIRQLLTEGGLLAGAGSLLGLALGFAGIHGILALDAARLPRAGLHGSNVTLDWRVLLFTALATLMTILLFGLIPALQASRPDLDTALRTGSSRTGTGFRQNRAGSLLVIGEVSFALLSLLGAALLIRTLIAVRAVKPGFDPRNVVATLVTLDPRFTKASGVDQIGEDIFRRLRAIPGVEQAALTGLLPLEGNFNSLTISIVGRPLIGQSHGNARWMTVSPAYFDVLKIPLARGRLFTSVDQRVAPPVAIINQAMERQFWPDGDPLKDRLIIGNGLGQNFREPARQIIGIVADVHEDALNLNPAPAVFVPSTQRTYTGATVASSILKMWVVVRTRSQSQIVNSAIQNELRQSTGGLPVAPLRSMEEILVRSTASQNFNMTLMSIFGGCSLLLAAIGIYGVLAYSVQQRSREMGIRMALGAKPSDVRNMVVFQGMLLAVAGAGIGMTAALGLTRFIKSFLFGVGAWDPLVFILAPIVLTGVALVAVWVPALRASRVDPANVLRSD